MCLVRIWVHKTGFQLSTCTKPRHWVIMCLCTRAVDFASLNFWFWNCSDSVVCFVSRFIIYIILLSVHYAKIVAMVEDVVLDLLPYYTSLTCSIHSSMLVNINSWQYYHLLLPCYASIKRSNDLRGLVFIYYWQ